MNWMHLLVCTFTYVCWNKYFYTNRCNEHYTKQREWSLHDTIHTSLYQRNDGVTEFAWYRTRVITPIIYSHNSGQTNGGKNKKNAWHKTKVMTPVFQFAWLRDKRNDGINQFACHRTKVMRHLIKIHMLPDNRNNGTNEFAGDEAFN